MDYIFLKYINNTVLKNGIEKYFLNSHDNIEYFKKDKSDKDKLPKDKSTKDKSTKTRPKAKVYHHKVGSAKSEYTEDFENNKKDKIYIMLPKNSLKNSIDIWIPNF